MANTKIAWSGSLYLPKIRSFSEIYMKRRSVTSTRICRTRTKNATFPEGSRLTPCFMNIASINFILRSINLPAPHAVSAIIDERHEFISIMRKRLDKVHIFATLYQNPSIRKSRTTTPCLRRVSIKLYILGVDSFSRRGYISTIEKWYKRTHCINDQIIRVWW